MNWHVLRLAAEVELPHGAAPGASREGSTSILARDGNGAPLLRGSALAGVLRSQWRRRFNRSEADARKWFGTAASDGSGQASRVMVEDIRFEPSPNASETRVHNLIDRHTGAAVKGGLFFVEAIAPGAKSSLRVVMRAAEAELAEAKEVLGEILGLFDHGVTVGGGAARGTGTLRARMPASFRQFDLASLDDHAAWLDERREQIAEPRGSLPPGDPLASSKPVDRLTIDLVLQAAQGQDWLVGGDSGLDASIEPQRIVGADGRSLLRFPGSAFRGVMRKWVARLAAREGKAISDSYNRAKARQRNPEDLSGAELGWGFVNTAQRAELRANPALVDCPVLSLFGSLYAKGRVHVSDSIVAAERFAVQRRTHVSIDRFGGGASNGFLFSTDVVCGAAELELRIEIERPQEQDARWIAQTLKAVDLGVLRIGSSKAAGRFEVRVKQATGPQSSEFTRVLSKGAMNHA
jgi:CRISPR/Cas system CSM-associated protein Csm3 (group 7 of RAMP superfamily)